VPAGAAFLAGGGSVNESAPPRSSVALVGVPAKAPAAAGGYGAAVAMVPAATAGAGAVGAAAPVEPAMAGVPEPRSARAFGPARPAARGVAPARPLRFAALGDSLTEGVGDRVDGAWRGWAALLAVGVGEPGRPAEFRNFAVSGALTRDVDEKQTPNAVAYGPDIAAVVVGVNDTLRHTFDIHDLAVRLNKVCAALSERGTRLITACLPDPGAMLGLPAPLARPLARRQRGVNAVVHALSERYGALHLHIADATWVEDRTMWSADRLHPGERGHRMIAARFHELLAAEGLALGQAPGAEPTQPAPSRIAKALWLATAGTAWVARRCTDLLPQLVGLAGAEVRHWARGSSACLDLVAENALSSALASLSLDPPLARMGE
ncbi:SGNH/GDSL hydrolase family protein, partial [Streptomyces sp. NPDC054841]